MLPLSRCTAHSANHLGAKVRRRGISQDDVGVGDLAHRLLRVILDTIWISTGPKEFGSAIAHRTSYNIDVRFRKDLMTQPAATRFDTLKFLEIICPRPYKMRW